MTTDIKMGHYKIVLKKILAFMTTKIHLTSMKMVLHANKLESYLFSLLILLPLTSQEIHNMPSLRFLNITQ